MSMVGDVTNYIKEYDPEVGGALEQELGRQRRNLELIASENFTSRAVMEAQGSVLTNKYAEGYPGARYYGGCAEESEQKIARHVLECTDIAHEAVLAITMIEVGGVAHLVEVFPLLLPRAGHPVVMGEEEFLLHSCFRDIYDAEACQHGAVGIVRVVVEDE